jgi:hypothetical protein
MGRNDEEGDVLCWCSTDAESNSCSNQPSYGSLLTRPLSTSRTCACNGSRDPGLSIPGTRSPISAMRSSGIRAGKPLCSDPSPCRGQHRIGWTGCIFGRRSRRGHRGGMTRCTGGSTCADEGACNRGRRLRGRCGSNLRGWLVGQSLRMRWMGLRTNDVG